MKFQALRCLILILILAIAGCDATPESASDEQKDPHYLNGRSRVAAQDYKGAIEEFEKALEANPRSAAAHFELGWLNEEQTKDYAAAIYHYQQHLKLRPNSEYAERAKDRIRSCKMDLVKTEILAPVNQGMQRDLERLTAENLLLKRQLEAAQAQISALQTTPPQTFTPANVPQNSVPQSRPVSSQTATSSIAATRATQQTESRPVAPMQTHPRTHVVKAGETVTSIAAKYKVKLNAFLLANPNVDPRRLKIGQVLNVPSS